jgi:hypothetical protein
MARFYQRLLLIGVAAWGVSLLMCKRAVRRERHHTEGMLDEALDHTFPASDPTATQDFAIPANRL